MGYRLHNLQTTREHRTHFPTLLDGGTLLGCDANNTHKDFPLNSHGIRYLCTEYEEGVLYDLGMLLGLHRILVAHMAWLHGDADARPARQFLRERVTRFVEGQRTLQPVPEWLDFVETLTAIK